jgi:hypothetical protein
MDLRFRSVKRMFVMQPIKKHDYAVVGNSIVARRRRAADFFNSIGQERKYSGGAKKSALPPKADIRGRSPQVR